MNLRELIKTSFLFHRLVNRKEYFQLGVIFMLLKYAGEAFMVWIFQGRLLTLLQFFNPFWSSRWSHRLDIFSPEMILLFFWSLPFVWIGFSLSLRRCIDANKSPWWAFFFFIPGLNLFMMFLLSLLPSTSLREEADIAQEMHSAAYRDGLIYAPIAALLSVGVIAILVYFFNSYSGALFIGLPFFYGFTLCAILNSRTRRSVGYSMAILVLSMFLAGGLLMLFAMEGLICIAMAAPIFLVLGFIGVVTAQIFIKSLPRSKSLPIIGCYSFLAIPLVIEASLPYFDQAPLKVHEVLTEIEVDAPIEAVWRNVVEFSEITTPLDWYFQFGVAHPLRAVIEGKGVGAIRRCQFSTGDFVEPITVWDEPHILGFSVQFQPKPLKELSIYEQVHAPHLDGFIQSQRGEFRLVEISPGKTRLQGRTWYRLNIFPGIYWSMFSDYFIHKIHERVLIHIEKLAETEHSSLS